MEFVPEVEILEGMVGVCAQEAELDLVWFVVNHEFDNALRSLEGEVVDHWGVAGDDERQGVVTIA